MDARGVRKASVVTQAANQAGCRHYEKSGYTIENACRFHHFWLEASV
jgi:hypothetical protein